MPINTGYDVITDQLLTAREHTGSVYLEQFIQTAIGQGLLPEDYNEIVEKGGAEGYYARVQMQKHFVAWNHHLSKTKYQVCIKQKLYGGDVRLEFCPVRVFEREKINDMQYKFRREFDRRSKNLARQPDYTQQDADMLDAYDQLLIKTSDEARKISSKFREVKEIQ